VQRLFKHSHTLVEVYVFVCVKEKHGENRKKRLGDRVVWEWGFVTRESSRVKKKKKV